MDFTPSFNTDYKLRVVYENETYESSIEQLMHAVPIENLEQGGNTLFSGDEKEVIISYTDSAERDDFYLFDFGYQLYLATKDEFYQGNLFTFSYFYDDLLAGDQAVIKIMGIDERHFNFMTILIDQTEDGGNPFNTTPSTVRGNISNLTNPDRYPMGYFRLSETYSASLVLEQYKSVSKILFLCMNFLKTTEQDSDYDHLEKMSVDKILTIINYLNHINFHPISKNLHSCQAL